MKNENIKDILADVLKVGELGSRVLCRPHLPSPWGLQFTPDNKAFFHIVKEGSCVFYENKGAQGIKINQGDLLFIPKVKHYRLLSAENIEAHNYIDEIERAHKLTNIKGKEVTGMFCGSYELKSNMSLPFFSLLPSYIHFTSDQINCAPELNNIVQMLRKEDIQGLLGSELVISRFLDVLLILIVRSWLSDSNNEAQGWLLATLDSEVGEVLSIIHERPEEKITIEILAKETAMSRTKLLNRFTKLVGISPIQYLTNWRLDLAKQLLLSTSISIQEISMAVGYESEASFGRVFKKIEKTTPGQYRKKS